MNEIEKIKEKLEEYNALNKSGLKEAVSRHDEKAISYFENLIFAINTAIKIVDDVKVEYGSDTTI